MSSIRHKYYVKMSHDGRPSMILATFNTRGAAQRLVERTEQFLDDLQSLTDSAYRGKVWIEEQELSS
jgi:hypothetical protein